MRFELKKYINYMLPIFYNASKFAVMATIILLCFTLILGSIMMYFNIQMEYIGITIGIVTALTVIIMDDKVTHFHSNTLKEVTNLIHKKT